VNGLLIRDTRVSLNISLRGLAGTLGVTPTFLGEVERGKRPVPKDWEQKLVACLPEWETAARACVANKHPEYAALLTRADVPGPSACEFAERRWPHSGWDDLARDLAEFAAPYIARAREYETKVTELIAERDKLRRENEALRRGANQSELLRKLDAGCIDRCVGWKPVSRGLPTTPGLYEFTDGSLLNTDALELDSRGIWNDELNGRGGQARSPMIFHDYRYFRSLSMPSGLEDLVAEKLGAGNG